MTDWVQSQQTLFEKVGYMDNTTLIAFASRGGVTEEYASIIADVLREKFELYVEVVKIKRDPLDVSSYHNIIVGTGIRMFRMYIEARIFLENTHFLDKRVAIFLSSVEPKEDVIKKYLKPILEKNLQFKPWVTEVFGGRMKIFGKTVSDMREPDRAKSWAEELGKKFIN